MARDPLAPLSYQDIQRLLNVQTRSAMLPGRQEVARSRRQAQLKAKKDQAAAVGLAKALAELQAPIGGQALAGYKGAADATAGYAGGFTGQLREDAAADAQAASAILAQIGAPDAQQAQVTGVGQGAADHAYFLGGFNPASSLAREGAAFSAAQNQLPATTLGRGQQEVGQISRALGVREEELDQMLADLEAKRPGVRNEILQQLLANENAKAATQIQRDYLGLAGVKTGLDARSTVADITGIDPATGLPTLDAQGATAGAAGKRKKAQQAAVGKRQTAFRGAKRDAFELAADLHKGEKVDDPSSLSGSRTVRPSYADARSRLWYAYGQDLMRFATPQSEKAWRRQVYAMIDEALRRNGFRKKPAKRKANPKTGRYPGEAPG